MNFPERSLSQNTGLEALTHGRQSMCPCICYYRQNDSKAAMQVTPMGADRAAAPCPRGEEVASSPIT